MPRALSIELHRHPHYQSSTTSLRQQRLLRTGDDGVWFFWIVRFHRYPNLPLEKLHRECTKRIRGAGARGSKETQIHQVYTSFFTVGRTTTVSMSRNSATATLKVPVSLRDPVANANVA